MFDLKICIICLNTDVRLRPISGSVVQDIYEKLTNKVQKDGNVYFACYICYCQLKNCQHLITTSQRSEELLKQILPITKRHLRPISFLDRLTHGLVHSFTVTDIQSLQIPEYNEFIKTEKQESDTDEIVDGSDVEFGKGAPSPKIVKLGENNIKHGDGNSIENGKKENIFKETNTEPYSNNQSRIVNDEKIGKGAPSPNIVKLGENNIKHGDGNSVENGKTENIFKETNTEPYSNNQSRIVNDEKSKDLLVKKTFICNDCGKTCETKGVLIKHINDHKPVTRKLNGTNNWKSSCEKKYKKDIKENDTSNKNLPYKCKYCNYTCACNSQLKRHIRTHTGEKPFKCQYCNYTCSQNCNLKEHIRTHTGESPFKCQYCSYTCKQYSNLQTHIRTHTGEKPFKCQYCNYTCTQNSQLKDHIKTHTGEKPFKCQYCSYTCTVNSTLKIHIRTHTGEKPFKCQYCSYTCTVNSSLKIHMRTHTGEKPFKCQYCSYTCKRNRNLKDHISTHTGENLFKCQYCSYTSTDKYRLKLHIRTHTGEKPFKCQYCSYTCTEKSSLKKHIRRHTGEKPFKCQYCTYSCTANSNLIKHIRTHTGEKPFKCQYCSYTCSANGTLKTHIRTHTGEKPFKCLYCSYKCTENSTLKKHIRRRHGEEKPI